MHLGIFVSLLIFDPHQLQAYTEFFSRCLNMELTNTDVVVQTVTPGLIRAEDNLSDNTLSYLLPTTGNFVRNTVDSLGVSQSVTGSWIFSLQVRNFHCKFPNIIRRTLFDLLRDDVRTVTVMVFEAYA